MQRTISVEPLVGIQNQPYEGQFLLMIENLADDAIGIEIPHFQNFIHFLSEDIILGYLDQQVQLLDGNAQILARERSTYIANRYYNSALMDDLVVGMLEQTLESNGLNIPDIWRYLVLEHFTLRLGMQELSGIRNDAIDSLTKTMGKEDVDLVHLLADAIGEMWYKIHLINSNGDSQASYISNALSLFDINSTSGDNFFEKIRFLWEAEEGQMLRTFEFVKHFQQSKNPNGERVAQAFQGVLEDPKYKEFAESEKSSVIFAEKLFAEWLGQQNKS